MLTIKNKKGDRPLEKGITEWEKKKRRLYYLFIYLCMHEQLSMTNEMHN